MSFAVQLRDGSAQREGLRGDARQDRRRLLYKHDEFCIKNEDICIKNEEFCIKNDEFRRRAQAEGPRRGAISVEESAFPIE